MNKKININEGFFKVYKNLVEEEMIPYQYQVLHDLEKSHAIRNFEIAANLKTGKFKGWVFQDSDVYKWLEAVGYILQHKDDQDLENKADAIIEVIAKAQDHDGYLDTYFQISYPERKYKRLFESHELYCAGHFLEAAVAYYNATQNKLVLEIAIKLADQIDEHFGIEEEKLHIADGHEEIEIGLIKLYELTLNTKYLNLANYLLQIRGVDQELYQKQIDDEIKLGYKTVYNDNPSSVIDLKMYQAHKPILKQDKAVGHAVRFGYMATALAHMASYNNSENMYETAYKLWRNVVDKRMYITGGIGSTANGEAFTCDYDLPNDSAYSETCAAISLIFFAKQMLKNEINSEYADVMERALYNTTLAGMSLDAKHFYYVNPLEVEVEKCKCDPNKSHVKTVRQKWFGCACCPPNIARLISSLEDYIYTDNEEEIYLNLFIANEYKTCDTNIKVSTAYPKNGYVKININSNKVKKLGIRIPNWCEKYEIKADNEVQNIKVENGYALINGAFNDRVIEINFIMDVRRNYSNINVSENVGKVAISRGPLVYCVEEVDNFKNLGSIFLSKSTKFIKNEEDILGNITSLTTVASKLVERNNSLYGFSSPEEKMQEVNIKLIPYYAWANRGENAMRVWLNQK